MIQKFCKAVVIDRTPSDIEYSYSPYQVCINSINETDDDCDDACGHKKPVGRTRRMMGSVYGIVTHICFFFLNGKW